MEKDDIVETGPERDWLLQLIVKTVNGKDLEIGVTLNVGGFLASGLLVSGHKYFEGLAQGLSQGINMALKDPELANQVEESYSSLGNIYTSEDQAKAPDPHYVHLKGTKFFSGEGNPIPSGEGSWWRGRISEVSGFTLGNFTVTQ